MKPKIEKNEILFGIHSVFEALKAEKREVFQLFISEDRTLSRIKKIIDAAEKKNIPVRFEESASLDEMTKDGKHQGVAAKVGFFPLKQVDAVFKNIKHDSENRFILIMESLEDPHNFGALIRTALCAGVDFIMIPKDRAVSPSSSVSRASAGAMEHADISLITNTVSLLKRLKKMGFWVAGLDSSGETPLFNADLTGNLVLVVGGEHKGIRPLVKTECDFLVSLPQKPGVTSLNASVAGGIAMYEVLRQRDFMS